MTYNPERKQVRDEDYELVTAIQNGRNDLFGDLVKRYEQKLYNFGLRMCGDVCDAEDLVQDTFLNVFRYIKTFRYETKFKNWLYRIATSTCIKKRAGLAGPAADCLGNAADERGILGQIRPHD